MRQLILPAVFEFFKSIFYRKLSPVPVKNFRSFIVIIIAAFGLAAGNRADAQLFQQTFTNSFATVNNAAVTDPNYVSATPNTNQFTYLAVGTSGTNTITASGGTLQLTGTGTNMTWAGVRNANFPGPPTSLKVTFDANIDVQGTGSNPKFNFLVGSGFANTITAEANANIHSGFAIRYANSAYYFTKTLANGGNAEATADRITDATSLSFTFVINNSGAVLNYLAPDGSNSTVADDSYDVWVGTTLRLDDQAATTGTTTLSQIKFGDLTNSSGGRANWILDNVVVESVAPLLPPTVLTTAAAQTGKYTGTGSGNITAQGTTPVIESGIVWGTAVNPDVTLSTKTNNGPLTGTYTHNITGLNAGTLYHVRAYATNSIGTSYGADLTFTTAAATAPVLTTVPVTNVTIFTANSGGNISDSGGRAITQKGVCWATAPNPTTANSTTNNGTGAANFTSNMTGLTPSTTYYVRAYAINSVGTGYGNQLTFTTPAPSPTIIVNPTQLNFGTVTQNTISAEKTYTINGYFLTPAAGNITITAPTGFRVSKTTGAGFATSITLPYTGGTLPTTTIYVRFSPTTVSSFNSNITNAGGGATTANVNVTGEVEPAGLQSGQGFSNKGKEFWVGYAATEKMYGDNSQDQRFTFNNPNSVDATVTISMPNIPTFTPIVYTVPANSVVTTNSGDLPESGAEDARLDQEGVTNRGIRIVSNVDIVVYTHAITSQVYAATVLFPTNTLGRDYTSLNFRQRSNFSQARSFCFAIATENNTELQITLPPGVATETHAAGSTFTQTLQRGEVLNLFGVSTGHPNLYTGEDLTGTIVKSISTGANSCKPFAFYSGSSKITIDCDNGSNGSADNLLQQMFPKVAWGNKYILIPTQPLPRNYYRILVNDPATVVKVNGVTQAGIVNNTYYEYFNSAQTIDVVEADKPIMVAQYMTTHGECSNSGSNGDPEMIYLSSVQQTIDTVSVVSSPLGNGSGRSHYLNVAMKTSAVNTFQLDGVTLGGVFSPVPYDPTYSYAQLTVNQGTHTLASAAGFNATAFGIAGDESYGYNAGTNVKDLLSGFGLQNQYGTGNASNGCRGSEFFMSVTLPYRATQIVWDFNNNPNLTPNAVVTQNNPTPSDSFTVNNRKLYIFKLATPYKYNIIGSFPVKVRATSPTPDGCNGVQDFTFNVNIVAGPTANFTFTNTGGCLAPIQFTDQSLGNGGNLDIWQWDFGNSATSTEQNPNYTYAAGGTYTVKLRAITLEGCYHDTTKVISLSAKPVAGFTANAQGCAGQAHTFTNTSTIATPGTITQWSWNWGDATPVLNATTGAAQTHTFAAAGTYTVSLTVTSSTGCVSTVFTQQVVINPLPTVSFSALASVCTTTPAFTLTGGSPATGTQGTGTYTGPGVTNNVFTPATAGAGTHTITYTFVTPQGCTRSATQSITVTPAFNLQITPLPTQCTNGQPVTLVANQAGGVFSGPGVSGTTFTPSSLAPGTYTITYSIPGNTCTNPATLPVVVNPGPSVFAGLDVSMVQGYSITLNGTATGATSVLWSPATGLGSPTSLSTLAAPTQTTTYTLTGTNSFGCTASDQVIVTVIPICINPPNVFTPNGDGMYDKWVISNGGCATKIEVNVFNRWGGLVYRSPNYNNDWTGLYQNKALPDGTYYYVIRATLLGGHEISFKGNVTIMR